MPPTKRGKKRGSRSKGGGGGGSSADASQSQPKPGSGKQRAYSKLLSHVSRVPSRGVELDVEEQVEPRPKRAAPADDEDEDESPTDGLTEEQIAVAAAEEEEEEEETKEIEDDANQWTSASYEAHYGGEWPTAELDAAREAWGDDRVELPGLGELRALVPSKSAAAAAATAAAAASSAEAVLKRCGVPTGMRAAWRAAHGDAPLTPAQASLLAMLGHKIDVHHANTPLAAYAELTPILALHAVQHIVLTQKMLQRHRKKGLTAPDQGFTRPTVLVLLPFRAHALSFVSALLALLPPCYEQVENKSRFQREYDEEEDSPPMPASKPEDYKELFDGNNDDCFRCALRLTRKAAKLYSSFYTADLIVGSPLGLRTLIGEAEGKKRRKAGGGKEAPPSTGDADWLSSVELCLVPYADVLLMQNWAHVADLFEMLNRLPTQQRDTDFSRVRPWYLEGDSRKLRQTALLSSHHAPELSALLSRSCANVAGRMVSLPEYDGVLGLAPSGERSRAQSQHSHVAFAP